jgi:integrase
MKGRKGTVTVSSDRGMLRLHLPRHLFDGKQKYLLLGLADTPVNRQAAILKAQAIESDIAFERFDFTLSKYTSSYNKKDEIKLSDVWARYYDYKSRLVAKSTLKRDFGRIGNHIQKFPSDRLVDARKIKTYLIENVSALTAKRVLMYLSAACSWAVKEEIIFVNPFDGISIEIKGKKPHINPFSKAEMNLIISAFESHPKYYCYANFVKFLFWTGCRTSEAIGLLWEHISPNNDTITFCEALVYGERKGTKTGGVRRFPVNPALQCLIRGMRNEEDQTGLVFLSPKGMTINSGNFLRKAWKEVLGEIGIGYRKAYNTRHTFITICLESDIPISQVAAWVGNSPQVIWSHYAGLTSSYAVPVD